MVHSPTARWAYPVEHRPSHSGGCAKRSAAKGAPRPEPDRAKRQDGVWGPSPEARRPRGAPGTSLVGITLGLSLPMGPNIGNVRPPGAASYFRLMNGVAAPVT